MWEVIEQFLEERQWSAYQLAKRMKVSDASLTNIKYGKTKDPSFDYVCKLADAFEVTTDQLRPKDY